jgi:hypothetical protein
MPTDASPSAFDEFSGVALRLPEAMRELLRWPLGPLVHGADVLPAVGHASPVVTVGDFCTLDLAARGRTPDVCLVDFKTKRVEDPELHDALHRIGDVVMRVTNPAGTIAAEAWSVVREAFKSKDRVRVEVRGEEDLLALVCIALAPESGAILYGQPGQGVVVVKADQAAKARVLDLLRRMER